MVRTPTRGSGAPPRVTSSGTAERFAARVRSRRRRRWASAVAAVLVLAGLVWLVLFSPYLVVRRVQITGTDRVPEASVHRLVDAELGRPMVLLDPGRISSQVAAVPLVRSAEVTRRWPTTVVVAVHERVPVAVVPAGEGGSGYRLVDRDGVEVESMARRPAGLPFLEVDVAGGGPATLAAALDVQAGLPAELVSQVRTIGATSPDGVWFTLSNGAKVVWGDSGDGDAKLDVFGDLVGAVPDAAVYDVSAPTAPATSQRRLRKPVVLATR